MKKILLYGPQGSGKTYLLNTLISIDPDSFLKAIEFPKLAKSLPDSTHSKSQVGSAIITIEEADPTQFEWMETLLSGWQLGSGFKGTLIVTCQQLPRLSFTDWKVIKCNYNIN